MQFQNKKSDYNLTSTALNNGEVFTIPYNHTGYIIRTNIAMNRSNTANCSGSFWVKAFGASPRYRRPFSISQDHDYNVRTFTGVSLSERTDFAPVIQTCSANNTNVVAEYDILLIKN